MNRHISEHPCCQGWRHCEGAGHYKADFPSALKMLISAFCLYVGDHSDPLLLLALFYQSTPSCLKVGGGWWVAGGPCDYCVSPSPKNWVLGIFRLGQDFWVRTWGLLGRGTRTWTWA